MKKGSSRSKKTNEWLEKIKKEEGINKAEKKADDGPELYEDLYWVWNGFISLSQSRPATMAGPANITYSEMVNYCDLYSIEGYQKRLEFAEYVRMLDTMWLDHFYEKEQKRRAAEESKNKNNKNKR